MPNWDSLHSDTFVCHLVCEAKKNTAERALFILILVDYYSFYVDTTWKVEVILFFIIIKKIWVIQMTVGEKNTQKNSGDTTNKGWLQTLLYSMYLLIRWKVAFSSLRQSKTIWGVWLSLHLSFFFQSRAISDVFAVCSAIHLEDYYLSY